MKRKAVGSSIAVAIVAITALVVHHTGTLPDAEPLPAIALPPYDLLKTDTPRRRDFTETCRWFGEVKSSDRARVVALETGRIVSLDASDGMPVTKDALLFTIGGPMIDSRGEVLRDEAATLQKRVSLAERMVCLKREAVSQRIAKYEELSSAQDALARLKAELESAGQDTQRLQEAIHVRATLGGVFTNRRVSVGQEVQKGDYLAEIISVDHIYIAAALFPQEEGELEGKRAVIRLTDGDSVPGTISRVLPQKTAEGAAVVWIEGPDLSRVLRPGQTAAGTVVISVHKKALSIPQSAVIRDEEERAYVFLKGSSGYRRKHVETGIVAGGMVEITSGLREEDTVVVRGAYELFYRDFNKMYKVED